MNTMQPDQQILSDNEFSEALRNAMPAVWGFARSLTKVRDTADDLAQEAACKAWSARTTFARGTSIKAWMFTITRNLFLSQMRRAKWSGAMPENFDIPVAPSQISRLHLLEIGRKIEGLPPHQRQAVLLAMDGASYEEAAAAMQCKVGTVKSRISRARAALNGE